MPPLPGFTNNPLVTRHDLVVAAKSLIQPLERYRSALGARVKVRPGSAAGFDDVAAQLEGFARPLLAIGALIDDDDNHSGSDTILERWRKGLESGVAVGAAEYWGDMGDFDQRMVETESICLALLGAPRAILSSSKGNICSDYTERDDSLRNWLRQINDRAMPANNWRWFRVLVNLTLVQVLGVARAEVQAILESDLALLDSFYLGDGWSSDGLWGEDRKQADYYSGSFAMQFAQLLYVRFAEGRDEERERVERYKKQAKEFAAEYWRYFDVDGAAIPFGRSMTYRFAFSAFWAAAVVAGVELPEPVNHLGTVKGLLLRHLRWWTQHEDMFNSDGVMNIGFVYPNMYLCEDYNSPQSVYWCLKSFIVLTFLPADHPFWSCEELPHPLAHAGRGDRRLPQLCQTLWPPRHIIDSSPEHHYLLSAGQMTTKPHKAKDAKYGKFAYSSAFGFSVPAGPATLAQLAPDSTLCVSIDGGETWRVRTSPSQVRLETIAVVGENQRIQGLTSVWKPWKALDDALQIETTLVALERHAPGWHLRIHRVTWSRKAEAALLADSIQFVDGGFAIPALTATGYHVPEVEAAQENAEEWCCCNKKDALIRSRAGAGGISDLSSNLTINRSYQEAEKTEKSEDETFILRADPNTNLISPRTFIPCVRHHLTPGKSSERAAWLVSGVFAVSPSQGSLDDACQLWKKRPSVRLLGASEEDADVRFKVEISGP